MPPQQTNLTSEAGRDAAGLCLDLTAAPPVASTRTVFSLLQGYWRAFRERRQRKWLRVSLRDLSDRELMDIGLTPGDVDYLVADRAFERLRNDTRYLWLPRGVM